MPQKLLKICFLNISASFVTWVSEQNGDDDDDDDDEDEEGEDDADDNADNADDDDKDDDDDDEDDDRANVLKTKFRGDINRQPAKYSTWEHSSSSW